MPALLAEYRDAAARLAEHIRAIADPQAAFEASNQLFHLAGELRTDASFLRTDQVRRIWEAEELTLSVLAARTGLSKSRVDQMVLPRSTTSPTQEDKPR